MRGACPSDCATSRAIACDAWSSLAGIWIASWPCGARKLASFVNSDSWFSTQCSAALEKTRSNGRSATNASMSPFAKCTMSAPNALDFGHTEEDLHLEVAEEEA